MPPVHALATEREGKQKYKSIKTQVLGKKLYRLYMMMDDVTALYSAHNMSV
jgi:hypothetical protein